MSMRGGLHTALRKAYDIRRRIFAAESGRDTAAGKGRRFPPFLSGKTLWRDDVIDGRERTETA